MEGARLQVPDVDGARKLLHIHGKGGKDRYVPLPDATLALLREHWRTHKNPLWLFPTITRSHAGVLSDCGTATPPTFWRPASISGSSRSTWATPAPKRPPSTPTSPGNSTTPPSVPSMT